MPMPIRVSYVKRRDADGLGVEGLGGTSHEGRRWYMSEESLIREIEQPADSRRWDFYVQAGFSKLEIIVSWAFDRKYLTAAEPLVILRLPEWPHERVESFPC